MIVHFVLRPPKKSFLIRNIICNNKEYILDQIDYVNYIHFAINEIDKSSIFYTYDEDRVSCKSCLDLLMIKDIIE